MRLINKKYLYPCLLFAASFQSCDDMEVEKPDFNVELLNTEVKPGEEATFKVTGAPDFVTFFSGEQGSQYIYQERTEAEGTPLMSFGSALRWGSQQNTLQVMASTDFDGQADSASVLAASWTDISSKFYVDDVNDNYDLVESGEGDLSEFAGESLYIGFKFTGTTGSTQRTWRIGDFKIVLDVKGESYSLDVADMNYPGWMIVNIAGTDPAGSKGEWRWRNSFWQISGGRATMESNEDWLIAGPLFLTKVTPDAGIAKNAYSEKLDEFTHVYSKAGTYKATVVGINATVDDSDKSIRELTIEVVE
jgi:hypothetical protein